MQRFDLIRNGALIGFGAIGLMALSATASVAAPLGKYTFEGDSTLAPSSVNSAIELSAFAHSSGAGTFVQGNLGSLNSYSASGWNSNSLSSLQSFFQFQVTPKAANAVTLAQIMFDQRRSGSGPKNWVLRSSLDAFGTNLINSATPLADAWNKDPVTVTLPSQFENLTKGVTFRLYGYDAAGSTGTWRLDNVSIEGTVSPAASAVPTPAAIPAIVAFVVSLWRKRRGLVANRQFDVI
jgi:hypothetical protein